jgi:hypothetical protein
MYLLAMKFVRPLLCLHNISHNTTKLLRKINQGHSQHAKYCCASGLLLQEGPWVPFEVPEHGLTQRDETR